MRLPVFISIHSRGRLEMVDRQVVRRVSWEKILAMHGGRAIDLANAYMKFKGIVDTDLGRTYPDTDTGRRMAFVEGLLYLV